MVSVSAVTGRSWSETLVSRCQQLAGRDTSDLDGPELADCVRALTAAMPADLPMPDRFVTRNLVSTLVARVARVAGIDQRRDVLTSFVEWAASDVTSSEWHNDLERFIKESTDALRRQRDENLRPCIGDARIVRAMQMIESGYRDNGLSLTRVASHAGLSAWHAARLLKRFTGAGFTTIVHRTRVAAAQRLLEEGTCSVKEVATVVGYGSSSQLCAHFKRLIGTTPARYRIDHSLDQIAG